MSDSPARHESDSPARSRSPSPSPHDTLTLRALVSTKDAGVIIGKGGKNVADLREQTGVKAGVSKVIQGVHERVLTISGSVEAVAKAYSHIITQLVTSNPPSPIAVSSPSSTHTSIRLLISHNLMGTIIGRNGLKIKAIQDGSGARMIASKEMLPQSTERIVDVQGPPEAIGKAIEEIGKCLLEDWERGVGTVLFHPGTAEERSGTSKRGGHSYSSPSYSGSRRTNGDSNHRRAASPASPTAHSPVSPQPAANLRTQNISIPSDMVGCIIGRSGTKITEIRRLSGSKISIAKAPHDETGERMFTIVGTPEANEKALFLLYNQLESEKERRVGRDAQQQSD
ncbi:cytoplasmic protein [Pluteus cervinus]|uniref:Cytoplasmic protein n=1 Tax=Pluteus cervinus TaxID=181527 RepID=A0ACD3BGK2_9AGAR|nr:cytoplasmic protein [Pluteus cervinus]